MATVVHSFAEYAMRLKTSLFIYLAGMLCAAGAHAQSIPSNVDCPSLPSGTASDLQWVAMRTDTALLCRAVSKDNGAEAFALTLTRKSPFKPDSDLREEQGRIGGKKLWWYRSEIAGRPNELVRETLLKLDSGAVAHVFIRTSDATALTRYQQVVQDLDFAKPNVATR
jgi:hypothetical protein